MISVTIFFFRSRSVFARIAKIHFEGNAYISFRVEVWNFRLKKTNYVWKDQVFFFFFCSSRELKRSFESTLKSRNRTTAKRSHEGHYAERKEKERGRISIRESERQTNRRRRCVVIAREGACLEEHVHA